MSYEKTIGEDLKRARKLIDEGIYGADLYVARKLLQSFTVEIERLALIVNEFTSIMTIATAALESLNEILKKDTIRRNLVCDCGNLDDEDVLSLDTPFPPCSAECGRTMRLRE